MQRWTVALIALAGGLGAAVLALPAQAGTLGLVVKVTPSQGLKPDQTVIVSGHGLLPKASGGKAQVWFVTECTAAVRGRVDPATDTPHCDITHAQALRVSSKGTFSSRFRVSTGIVGDGYCGTAGHATCVIGIGTAQGKGTVVRITFRATTVPPAAISTTTSTTTTTAG